MSDDSVHAALRSDAPLVVEAPAGCGKTTKGADYAREMALSRGLHRLLILTHTHAACSVFAERTKGASSRVEIRTIDSVIAHIASVYHAGLDLPADIPAWIRQRKDGYAELALSVAMLLSRYPMIAASLAQRHRIVICDEHQDSSGEQHAIVMALQNRGARLRVFGDPMQKIFRERVRVSTCPPCDWDALTRQAQAFEQLDFPHRWTDRCPRLGQWTLAARSALKTGGCIDLRSGVPPSVAVVLAENTSQKTFEYQVSNQERRPIDAFERAQTSLLILTRYNETARAFRGFFNRRILLWEGHTRLSLEKLVDALAVGRGNRAALASAIVAFVGSVGKGFSPSAFGNRFEKEVREGCTENCRGKSAAIQELARFLVAEPNHCGVAKVLRRLSELATSEKQFANIEIDCRKEFWEAIHLGDFETADNGFTEIAQRRIYSHKPDPPPVVQASPIDKWHVTEKHSPMDDSKTVVLTLDSDGMVQGPLGAVKPSLIVRCQEKRTAVYVVTGMAANIETDSDGGPSDYHKVGIRLDDSPANRASWSESTDHKALFANDLTYGGRSETIIDFAKKLAGANNLIFQFTPFDGSPQVAQFDLRGLDPHLHKVAEACGWAYE